MPPNWTTKLKIEARTLTAVRVLFLCFWLPAPLIKIIVQDKNIKKIGLSLNNDIIGLKRITDINPEGFIDLQKRVNEYAIADMSLQRIYAIIFGKKISKSQRLTNWEAPTLTTAQQKYAALDAFSCLEIYDHLNKGLFVPENSPYIIHEIDNDNETEKI